MAWAEEEEEEEGLKEQHIRSSMDITRVLVATAPVDPKDTRRRPQPPHHPMCTMPHKHSAPCTWATSLRALMSTM